MRRPFLYARDIFVAMAYLEILLAIPQRAFGWGREGHQIIALVAEYYMRPETAARVRELLTPRPNAVRPYMWPRIPSPQPPGDRPVALHRHTGFQDRPGPRVPQQVDEECPGGL